MFYREEGIETKSDDAFIASMKALACASDEKENLYLKLEDVENEEENEEEYESTDCFFVQTVIPINRILHRNRIMWFTSGFE